MDVKHIVGRRSAATLYNCDNRDVLPEISADLVVTSPPYNLGERPWQHLGHWKAGDSAGGKSKWKNGCDANGVHYGTHNDAMPWAEYVAWQQVTLRLLWGVIGEFGAIYYNHKPRVVGVRLWTPLELVPAEVTVRQIITWARPGGVNYNPTSFVPTMEWVLLLAKEGYRLKSRGVSGLGDVWRMNPERNKHPAPFPVALPSNAIEASNCKTVLDPFMGSGTTGVAAVRAHKNFIGVEKDKQHFDDACDRIRCELAEQDALIERLEKTPLAGEPRCQHESSPDDGTRPVGEHAGVPAAYPTTNTTPNPHENHHRNPP